jgi:(2R)-sulfolactate sulfo-lyase subunit alpha
MKALQDIPLGHKIALTDMSADGSVIKYGADIGRVVADIKAGEHVHTHNLKTRRW